MSQLIFWNLDVKWNFKCKFKQEDNYHSNFIISQGLHLSISIQLFHWDLFTGFSPNPSWRIYNDLTCLVSLLSLHIPYVGIPHLNTFTLSTPTYFHMNPNNHWGTSFLSPRKNTVWTWMVDFFSVYLYLSVYISPWRHCGCWERK